MPLLLDAREVWPTGCGALPAPARLVRPARAPRPRGARPSRVAAWTLALLTLLLAARAPAPARAEPFLDLYLGKSFTRDADLRVRQPSLGNDFRVEGVSFDDESFEAPLYYGVRAGYFLRSAPWLGAALEFFHFKVFAETSARRRITGVRRGAPVDVVAPVSTAVQSFGISHGVNYLMADLLLRRPLLRDPDRFPNGRVQLYGGLGAGPVIVHPENRVEGRANDERYEVGGPGVQAFAGARVLLVRHVGLFAEYKLTASDLEVGVAAGEARLAERTHHAVVGLTISFPGP